MIFDFLTVYLCNFVKKLIEVFTKCIFDSEHFLLKNKNFNSRYCHFENEINLNFDNWITKRAI